MSIPPELIEKAATHLPTCAYIALTIWGWLMVTFVAVLGVAFILAGVVVWARDWLERRASQ